MDTENTLIRQTDTKVNKFCSTVKNTHSGMIGAIIITGIILNNTSFTYTPRSNFIIGNTILSLMY